MAADTTTARRRLAELLGGAGGPRIGPASFSQRRQWIIDRLVPGSAEYNVAIVVRIRAALDVEALRTALERTVARQESLRTVFVTPRTGPGSDGDTALLQRVLPAGRVELPVVDVGGERDPIAAARAHAVAMAAEPFDLAGPILLRPALVRAAPDDHLLVVITHHIVCDGWSAGILCRELDEQYLAVLGDRPARLPALPVQYLDHARLERRALGAERLAAQVDYWRTQLRGVPRVLRLPLDRPRAAVRKVHGDLVTTELPDELVARLQEFAAREGTTLFVVLLAAFHALLARYSGQPAVVAGVPVAGRTRTDVENLVGFFVNTLVLRGDVGDNPGLAAAVRRTRDTVAGAFTHAEVPFERLVELLSPERDAAVSPFFQALFNYQSAIAERVELPGLHGTVEPLDNGTVRFDLEVNLLGRPGSVAGAWNYNSELFDRATVAQLAAHYAALLDSAVRAPHVGLLDVPLDSPAERAGVVALGVGPGAAVPAADSVFELVARAGRRNPDAVAILAGGQRITYRELLERSERLAAVLRSHAPGPVGLVFERSPDLVAALLACSAAGVPAVPLDPAAPPGHLRDALAHSGAGVVLTRRATAERLPAGPADVVTIDRLPAPVPPAPARPPHRLAGVALLRYRRGARPPEATVVGEAAAVARCARLGARFPLGPDVRFLHACPPDGDLVTELLLPLSRGATVVLAPPAREPDPVALVEIVRAHEVRVACWPPRVLDAVLATAGVEGCRTLWTILCAGAPLGPHTLRAAAELLPGADVHPCYSHPATGIVVVGDPPHAERLGMMPTGRPLPGVRVGVLDAAGAPAPPGVLGELVVAGLDPVAGLLDDPVATAASHVPDPDGPPGARALRTGDLARLRRDGSVEVLGRRTGLTAVHGVVLEPGEIEGPVAGHPGVASAAVVLPAGASAPIAYVCARPPARGAELLPELGARARRLLPKDLVPDTFVELDRMPLLPDGTLDAAALPVVPWRTRWTPRERPMTPIEERIAAMWRELLGRTDVGVDDDFFHVGGHSLLAVRLADRLTRLGVEIPVSMLFRYRTVAALAEWLGELGLTAPGAAPAGPPGSRLVRLQSGAVPPPLVVLPGAGGTALAWSALVSALPDRTVHAVEADPAEPGADLTTTARHHLAAVVDAIGVPPVLAGWSMGGVVALEMACLLADAHDGDGERLPAVVLVDSPRPGSGPDDADVEQALVDSFVAGLCREAGEPVPPPRPGPPQERLRGTALGLDDAFVARRYAIYRSDMLALRAHRPRPYRGPVHVVRAAADPAAVWVPPHAVVHDVAGDHWSVLDREHVQDLAVVVEEVLRSCAGPGVGGPSVVRPC